MSIYEPFALIALGVFTGTYGIIIGAGGGFILGPMLILVWGLSPAVAVGTSTAAVLLTAVSGAREYARSGVIDVRSGVLFGVASVPGAALGAFAVAKAPAGLVQIVMGTLLLGTALYLTLRPLQRAQVTNRASETAPRPGYRARVITTKSGQTHRYSINEPQALLANAAIAVISTFTGVGGGLLRVPVLAYLWDFPLRIAVATSVLTMIFVATVGTATQAVLGKVDWGILLFAGIGVVVGGRLGASIAPKLRQTSIVRMLAGGMGVTGIWLIVKGVGLV